MTNEPFQIVSGRYGRILLPLADQYIARSFVEYGEFSQGEADLFDELIQPGMIVADVGANFGSHTLVFAKKAGRVYAIEPQRMVYNALCGTLALNLLFNVMPIHAAAGAAAGFIECADVDFSGHVINVGAMSLPEIPARFRNYTVPLIPFNEPCHFMKIDVEGMEEAALRGSSEMIAACRPVIYVENDRKDRSDSLIKCLAEFGYRMYWHLTPLFNKDNHRGNQINVFGEISSLNMLCIPKGIAFEGNLPEVNEPFHQVYTYTQ